MASCKYNFCEMYFAVDCNYNVMLFLSVQFSEFVCIKSCWRLNILTNGIIDYYYLDIFHKITLRIISKMQINPTYDLCYMPN